MKHHHITLSLLALLVIAGGYMMFCTRPTESPGADKTDQRQTAKPGSLLDESKLIDLTYDYDDKTIYWPTAKPFTWEKEAWGESAGGYWYTAARYSASEHGGTHLDAPIHFSKDKATTDAIPISKLVGAAVAINIATACAQDRNYRLSVADIELWEKLHGRIPDHAIVLIHTGWGKFWPDKMNYLGTDKPGDVAGLSFPGISKEAATLLAEQRTIDGIGIDTASLDYGQSKDFIAHQILNGKDIYGLENVANLDKLPTTGATLIALPMKIKGGTGGPVRIIALLP